MIFKMFRFDPTNNNIITYLLSFLLSENPFRISVIVNVSHTPTLTLHQTVVKQKIFQSNSHKAFKTKSRRGAPAESLCPSGSGQDRPQILRGSSFAPMMLPAFKPIAEAGK